MVGQKVIIRDYEGRPLARTVWAVKDGKILITDDVLYKRMKCGLPSPTPIGFPSDDVFYYDQQVFAKLERDYADHKQIQWEKLKPMS